MKHLIVFSMKGCPHCSDFKDMLQENDILFYDHDIDEYKEEYDMFVEITENEFVPAFMIIEVTEEGPATTKCFAPDRNFETIQEALEIAKKELI
jgi:glutaredoxin